ncbi:hypothetical protein [Catenuloplanes atrovinosus]|uniref:Uncharacterized protein n=1 Tax=Catenuloplanes atrovinosus TaxID=137266 RepID=A0AAE3YQ11_9ACTN|nr:hypothetical protein [Catenuloplanes atrovinosus]MDR7276234.1 hypothetical protein [Catenuloplanes atrovinosus]
MDPIHIPPSVITYGFARVTASAMAVFGLLWLVTDERMRPALDRVLGAGPDVAGGLLQVWPLFAWAVAAALVAALAAGPAEHPPGTVLRRGMWLSLNAGFFEEVLFRWLFFVSAVPILTALNWITAGLIRRLYETLLIPLANVATLGLMEAHLTAAPSWVLAAALLTVNGRFRNLHAYLGVFGWINSWYIGMVMFYLTFGYGLVTAMIAHAVYDAVIILGATVAAWRRHPHLTHPYPRY